LSKTFVEISLSIIKVSSFLFTQYGKRDPFPSHVLYSSTSASNISIIQINQSKKIKIKNGKGEKMKSHTGASPEEGNGH